jgi:hypothetical protein
LPDFFVMPTLVRSKSLPVYKGARSLRAARSRTPAPNQEPSKVENAAAAARDLAARSTFTDAGEAALINAVARAAARSLAS